MNRSLIPGPINEYVIYIGFQGLSMDNISWNQGHITYPVISPGNMGIRHPLVGPGIMDI